MKIIGRGMGVGGSGVGVSVGVGVMVGGGGGTVGEAVRVTGGVIVEGAVRVTGRVTVGDAVRIAEGVKGEVSGPVSVGPGIVGGVIVTKTMARGVGGGGGSSENNAFKIDGRNNRMAMIAAMIIGRRIRGQVKNEPSVGPLLGGGPPT